MRPAAILIILAALMTTAAAPDAGTPKTVASAAAIAGDTAEYVLDASTFSDAAGIGDSSDSYRMDWTMGELAVATGSSPSYQVVFGFLPGCGCPCHADPECDGATSVLDVVRAVNVAFRGTAPSTDPDCPYEQTDVSCDGATNVIDVVKFVNVAFRGGDPAEQFCAGCGE
ncbi:MAG TPA: hypothetical protein VM118_04915 [Acidobacteriota bacterium]|nr:hypothetical protein [Acidobacteriota bacterium]